MFEPLNLSCADGFVIHANLYRASVAKGVVLIASALGIPQRLYRHYATYLCANNWHCLTFDYRGTGASRPDHPAHEIRLEDWGRQDINAVLGFARALAETGDSKLPVHFLGHSIGGQLVGFSPQANELRSIIHIAVSSPFWKRWPFPGNLKVKFLAEVLIPVCAMGQQDFPTKKLGLGTITVPSTCVRQWGKWMSQPDYLFAKTFKFDTSNYQALDQPILALGFDDDELAPEVNIDEILKQFSSAAIEKRMLRKSNFKLGSVGHSGYFRETGKEGLWPITLDWINRY